METFLDRLHHIVKTFNDGKQTVFAAKAGIPKGTFHKYYDKGAFPTADHLVRIHEYTGCSIFSCCLMP
jgi:predicted transcriptional regulator